MSNLLKTLGGLIPKQMWGEAIVRAPGLQLQWIQWWFRAEITQEVSVCCPQCPVIWLISHWFFFSSNSRSIMHQPFLWGLEWKRHYSICLCHQNKLIFTFFPPVQVLMQDVRWCQWMIWACTSSGSQSAQLTSRSRHLWLFHTLLTYITIQISLQLAKKVSSVKWSQT